MTRQEKAQRLAETPECVGAEVSTSAIMRYAPAEQVHKCFAAVFRYQNRGSLSRLIETIRANREKGHEPNKRQKGVVSLQKPWKASPQPQLPLKLGGAGSIAHMLATAAGLA